MFLIHCLWVSTFAYWWSALLAETIFVSDAEKRLPAPVRAGLGLLLSIIYFSAAWQLMSIGQAWMVGGGLLAVYTIGNLRRIFPAGSGRDRMKDLLAPHLRGWLASLAIAILFFAPLIVANEYGPFTESSGDVTIYSDSAKLLTDGGMTAFGQPSSDSSHVEPNLRALLNFKTNDRYVRYAHAREPFLRDHQDRMNPPAADAHAYRTIGDIFFSSIFYAPYAQFHFLSGATKYPAYYGMQALLYAFVLLPLWFYFRRFGRFPAVLATAIAGASHGLVSVYYNMYSMQGIGLAISALMLCMLPYVRLFSIAGFRSYGIGVAIVWLCYTHYLSVVGLLLLVAACGPLFDRRPPALSPAVSRGHLIERSLRFLMRALPLVVFVALAGLLIASGSGKAMDFVTGLLKTFAAGTKNVYLGDHISPLSFQWLEFFFGFVSQQHLEPYATEVRWVIWVMRAGVVAGIACVVLGLVLILKTQLSRMRAEGMDTRRDFTIYVALVLTVAVHMYLAQTSLYTQAKGAQNVLVLTYTALALPLALGLRGGARDPAVALLTPYLQVGLMIFAAALFMPRIVYGLKLAHGEDRATILESSYFDEAERIRREDPNPFVLFEPRKSADLYVSPQPFAGARMVPTRHLALERVFFAPTVYKERVVASDLIGSGDLAHLWLIAATNPKGSRAYTWKADRVTAGSTPALYMFGDDYERNHGERPRSADTRDVGMFSYLRNAAALLFLPPGAPIEVEVRLAPRDPAGYAPMLAEVSGRVQRGQFGQSARIEHGGGWISLRHSFAGSHTPRFVPIAQFSGEYWMNVRLDGKELAPGKAPESREAPNTGKVTAVLRKTSTGGLAVDASWSGIRSPHKEDWIGVFPVGGDDASRLTFSFLGAKAQGTLTISLPAGTAEAPFEVRLFEAGSWKPIATSLAPPQPSKP